MCAARTPHQSPIYLCINQCEPKTRTLFAKSSQRFLKVTAQYVPISKGIQPAHRERLTMKNSRTAVAALLIAGFALTSTGSSFAVDATKAERVAARAAFKVQMDTFKAAAAARHIAAVAAHATIDAARATAKAAKAAATTADQKACCQGCLRSCPHRSKGNCAYQASEASKASHLGQGKATSNSRLITQHKSA